MCGVTRHAQNLACAASRSHDLSLYVAGGKAGGRAGGWGLTRVGVGEQRADGQQDLGDGERRAPLLLENVQADLPAAVHVAVIDPRPERHLRGETGVQVRRGERRKK